MSRVIPISLFLILSFAAVFDIRLSLAPGLSVKNAFIYVVLGLIAIRAAMSHSVLDAKIQMPILHLFFVSLIAYAGMSWVTMTLVPDIYNYDVIRGLMALKAVLIEPYLVLIVFFFLLADRDDVVWVIKGIVLTVAVVNMITMLDAFNVLDFGIVQNIEGTKNWGPMGSSNSYGSYIIAFLPAMLALSLGTKGTERYIFSIGFFVSLFMLVATLSRGAWVGLLAGSFVAVVLLRSILPFRVAMPRVIGIGAGLLVVVLLSGYGEIVYDRIFGIVDRSSDMDMISSGRLTIWGEVLGEMFTRPLALIVGMGWDSYDQSGWFRFSTHNTYLEYFFQLGAIGLLLYLLVLLSVVKIVVRSALAMTAGPERLILVGFVFGFASLIIAIFFGNLYGPWIYVWSFAGLSLRLALLEHVAMEAPTPSRYNVLPASRPAVVPRHASNYR